MSSSIASKFKDILKSNGIYDKVSEVDIRDTSMSGENFGSQTQLVTIKFENPEKKPLNLFAKVMTGNEAHMKMTEEGKLFKKESTFFMKYLPEAKEFCKSLGHVGLLDPLFPKCYFGDETMIVLENLLLDKGFMMIKRGDLHSFEFARLSLQSIAKHHAISRAYMEHVGGPEIFFKRFPTLDFETFAAPWAKEMMGDMIEKTAVRDLEIFQTTDVEEKEAAIKFLQAVQGTAYNNFIGAMPITPEDRKFLTLNHGDFHTNNMMFKTDEDGKPYDHILIDLQVTRYGSLCLDLHCYLALSVETSIRRERLRELLNIYLKTLKETSEQLGYPFDITLDELEKNYHHKRLFGFWYSLLMDNGLVFKVMSDMKPEELPDLSKKINTYILKWLQEHPEEHTQHAKELLKVFKEYRP